MPQPGEAARQSRARALNPVALPHQCLDGVAPRNGRRGRRHGDRVRRGGRRRPFAGGEVLHHAFAEDDGLHQRVGGEPVSAVNAGAGDLAASVEPGHRGPSVNVGADAAHEVVGRRRNGDGRGAHIDTDRGTVGIDPREADGQVHIVEARTVEDDGIGTLSAHLGDDGAGDDVAGREVLLLRGVAGHKRFARAVAEDRAFATDGLAYEKGRRAGQAQGRGVELVELKVSHFCPGFEGESDAVAGRDIRVRRVGEELPGATRREDDGRGAVRLAGASADIDRLDAGHARAVDEEPGGEAVVEDGNRRLAG